MKIFTTLNLILFAMFFTNCNQTKKIIESKGSEQLTGMFIVTALNKTKISKDKGMSFEISEQNNSIRGTTGCNSFFGTITKEGNSLLVTEMNISENYCDEAIMKSEQTLMSTFNAATSYMLKEQVLTLYSDSGKSVILVAVKDTIQ